MVLAELAPFAPKYNPKFVIDYWHEHAKSATGQYSHRCIDNKLVGIKFEALLTFDEACLTPSIFDVVSA